ncbi:hypothetical protein RF11_01826 [Thelohanellus kitauei]|uniref:Uncharacterized protein n=1 Tax=Thelohanellus kitauei TaxID=669202 RepID=A0A0C2M7W9_THEKT|nr:hypothetical protein RF11_01826 [Thelohanellus kitauei]
MNHPVDLIVPSESVSRTINAAIESLKTLVSHSSKVFEHLETRIKALENEIEGINKCMKKVQGKIDAKPTNITVYNANLDFNADYETQSLNDIYELCQEFNSSSQISAEFVDTLEDYLAAFNNVEIRKLPIDSPDLSKSNKSSVESNEEVGLVPVIEVQTDGGLMDKRPAQKDKNEIKVESDSDPIPFSLLSDISRAFWHENNSKITRQSNLRPLQKQDVQSQKMEDVKNEPSEASNSLKGRFSKRPKTAKKTYSVVDSNTIPEAPIFSSVCEGSTVKKAGNLRENTIVTNSGSVRGLLADIRNAKGGKGLIKLKSVDVSTMRKVESSCDKPGDLFDSLVERLKQRRQFIKEAEESKFASQPIRKLSKQSLDNVAPLSEIEEF